MERLTKLVGYRNDIPIFTRNARELRGRPSAMIVSELIDRLGPYEESGLTLEQCMELAAAQREGRLVVLPPIKDATVYIIEEIPETNERWVTNRPVNYFDITGLYCGFGLAQMRYDFADMGDKWFLTREAAETALATQREAQS